jgi:hypothetical protein
MNHLSLLHTEHILSSSKVHKNIFLLLSSDHHMNAHHLLKHRTYLDIHIMVYKIDKIILVVSLIKCQNIWFLLQPLPCNKNRSYCFHIEQIQYFIYVLWQNYISAIRGMTPGRLKRLERHKKSGWPCVGWPWLGMARI